MHLNTHIDNLLMAMNNPSLPGIDLSLDRMRELLAALGNPQLRVPPVIHVAGTNGKGSVMAYLRAMYAAAGYRVHAYISPHLVRFNERILLGGTEISDAQLTAYLQQVQAAARAIPVTFFEATTAAAFLAFAAHPADVLLLETGLGGRLDATNVIAQPLCTVITPIDFDHMEFLGETIAKIAAEKAGIMKNRVPCVSAQQPPDAAAVLIQRGAELDAPLLLGGRDWDFSAHKNGFLFHDAAREIALPMPGLAGAHQCANAALAASVALVCREKLPINEQAMAEGIARTQWPARLQQLTYGPLVECWGGEVRLDGGHNAHAARAIAAWARSKNHPVVMICAMMRRKDAHAYFAALAPVISALYCIPMPQESEGYRAAELAEHARAAGITEVAEAADMVTAAQQLQTHRPATLLIAGSLHLAGEVLKNHG